MRQVGTSRPSPAIVIAILALVAALAGTALAGPDASTSALNKKKVKKIAKKQVKKLAPGLSVANADALGGKPPSTFASATSEPYHEVGTPGEPPFQSGWTNTEPGVSTAAFYKDSLGVVHLKGVIAGGGNGNTAFTLPTGYRPSQGLLLPAAAAPTQAGQLLISPSGSVAPACDVTPCIVGMDGVGFRVP
jgi:hypothetical protein